MAKSADAGDPMIEAEKVDGKAAERAAHRQALEMAAALPIPDEERAISILVVAHGAQRRRGTNLPYVTHPLEVLSIVKSVPGSTRAQRLAALLHDVVEDSDFTGVNLHDVRRWFYDEVATLVEWLTDVSRPDDGNRAQRKAIDRAHSAEAPGEAQTVKLADIFSNARDVVQLDPKFARTWLPEKILQVEVLERGDADLHRQVRHLLREQMALLETLSPAVAVHRNSRP